MNKEVIELIEQLKEYRDGFTSVLAPTEESVKEILDYINQLETDKTHLIEIISGLINYVKETYNEDLIDRTAGVMEIFLSKGDKSNE